MESFSYRDKISVDEFFTDFLYPNRPCLISNLTNDWKANEWRKGSGVNFEMLSSRFGSLTVPVADCDAKEFNANPKSDWKFQDYLKYWKEQHDAVVILPEDDQRYSHLILEESAKTIDSKPDHSKTKSNLYLKDWHFIRDVTGYVPYTTPLVFSSDWLNEFYSQRTDVRDDYKFVYMGPKGTWTPLHYDVFRSYSWSANIAGTKMWIVFPEGDEKWLKNIRGELEYDAISRLEGSGAAEYIGDIIHGKLDVANHFKEFSLPKEKLTCSQEEFSKKDHLRVIVVLQRRRETIFIPSGWHHQVHNIDDVISINHNWVNACNVYEMWANLSGELERVRTSISDCVEMEGWHSQCQLILSSLAGMDYSMLCKFILVIALPRLVELANSLYRFSGCKSIADRCNNMKEYVKEYLLQQREFELSTEIVNKTIFIPYSDILMSYLPSFLSSSAQELPRHVMFSFFEFSKLSVVLNELVLSKDIHHQFQDCKLFGVIKIFQKDLSSLWLDPTTS